MTSRSDCDLGRWRMGAWDFLGRMYEEKDAGAMAGGKQTLHEFLLLSIRPDHKRHLAEDEPLCLRRQWQCPEGVERFLDVVHTWPWPVATEERFVGDLC